MPIDDDAGLAAALRRVQWDIETASRIENPSVVGAEDIAAVEINEAFAIQVLASSHDLKIPLDKINTWGGAMAVGHPLGASGLRLVMTLHDRLALADEDNALGIATLCVGGGQGMTMLFRYRKLG